MRDVITLFIEASVSKGEWQVALSALQLPQAAPRSSSGAGWSLAAEAAFNLFRLSSTLSRKGEWMAALAVLRNAPLPFAAHGQKQYSSAYLAARVRAYQHVLEACCSTSSAAAIEDAAVDTRATASARDVNASAEDLSFECALGLVEEALFALDGAAELCGQCGTPLEEVAGGDCTKPLLTPVEASSLESKSGAACVEDLLRWCRAELPRRRSPTGVATLEQTEVAMQRLTKLSAEALRGVSETRMFEPKAPSKELSNGRVPDLGVDSSCTRTASDQQRAVEELTTLLAGSSRAANAWVTSLNLLQRIPSECVTGHLFTALLRHLLEHHRGGEVARLLRTFLLLQPCDDSAQSASQSLALTQPSRATAKVLRADSTVIKAVAEACHRLRRSDFAAALLLDTEARAAMTPSAAVPLVMTLRDAGAYSAVLLWWERLRQEQFALRYPLLRHAKLSSYVASCVLRHTTAIEGEVTAEMQRAGSSSTEKGTRGSSTARFTGDWQRALDAFRDAVAPSHDPALLLLFQLRVLRQAGQWNAAVQLFNEFCQTHPNARNSAQSASDLAGRERDGTHDSQRSRGTRCEDSYPAPARERVSAMKSACAVLTQEHAEQWMPLPVLARLRRQVQDWKP
ncbi:hypothetical protein LSCM1_02652 [Leishmania martiniquensis]|uniref:Uncharacterized protein n=1 Tax=Leishmania martiniquensis TaxID=1580590 RepID=A0A836KEC6_9TRYP|nr:hypothetical protein LSCM1_02652 [Leishmania martiniquensis]